MLNTLAAFVGGIFSSSKATDTAIDAVRKIGGLDDMNAKEKADWLLRYIETTKHQSPARRLIAVMMLTGVMTFTGTWLLLRIAAAIVAYFDGDSGVLLTACDDIYEMCNNVLMQPMNIIIGFYFVTDIAKRFSK